MSRAQLFHTIARRFILSELKAIAYELQIDYEELEGSAKSDKVRSLIRHSAEQAKLPELLDILRRDRPAEEWPSLDELTAEVNAEAELATEETLRYIRRGLNSLPLRILLWVPQAEVSERAQRKQAQIQARLADQFKRAQISINEEPALGDPDELWQLMAEHDAWVVLQTSAGLSESIKPLIQSRLVRRLLLLSPNPLSSEMSKFLDPANAPFQVYYTDAQFVSCSLTEWAVNHLRQIAFNKLRELL